jgi:hypothetical protein
VTRGRAVPATAKTVALAKKNLDTRTPRGPIRKNLPGLVLCIGNRPALRIYRSRRGRSSLAGVDHRWAQAKLLGQHLIGQRVVSTLGTCPGWLAGMHRRHGIALYRCWRSLYCQLGRSFPRRHISAAAATLDLTYQDHPRQEMIHGVAVACAGQ